MCTTSLCICSKTANLAAGAANTNVSTFFAGIASAILSHKTGNEEGGVAEDATEETPLVVANWETVKQHFLPTTNN